MKRPPRTPMPLPLRLTASFFLIGEAAPFAPATFASFALLPFLYPFLDFSLILQLALIVGVTAVGIPVSTRSEKYYGHDGSPIVIDEVAGMLVTFLAVPAPIDVQDRLWVLLVGFFLFRVMDIVKPFPAGRAQNLPMGWGVMVDDLLAGIYANIALQLIMRWAGWV